MWYFWYNLKEIVSNTAIVTTSNIIPKIFSKLVGNGSVSVGTFTGRQSSEIVIIVLKIEVNDIFYLVNVILPLVPVGILLVTGVADVAVYFAVDVINTMGVVGFVVAIFVVLLVVVEETLLGGVTFLVVVLEVDLLIIVVLGLEGAVVNLTVVGIEVGGAVEVVGIVFVVVIVFVVDTVLVVDIIVVNGIAVTVDLISVGVVVGIDLVLYAYSLAVVVDDTDRVGIIVA